MRHLITQREGVKVDVGFFRSFWGSFTFFYRVKRNSLNKSRKLKVKIFLPCCPWLPPVWLTVCRRLGLTDAGHERREENQRITWPGRDIKHSHWSSSYNTALSLVESCRVLKYFHALKGPNMGAFNVAAPAISCHKQPSRASPFLLLAGSVWHKG